MLLKPYGPTSSACSYSDLTTIGNSGRDPTNTVVALPRLSLHRCSSLLYSSHHHYCTCHQWQVYAACKTCQQSSVHSSCTHAIFTYARLLHSSCTYAIRCLLNIFQQSPPLALMAIQAPACIRTRLSSRTLFSPFDINVKEETFFPWSCCKTYSPCWL